MHAKTCSHEEEWLNAATHAFGALLGVVGLILLIIQADSVGRTGSLAAVIVYGSSMVLLFLFSALHHAVVHAQSKQFLLALDHAGIYLLIAGTYTPFCLLLPSGQDWSLLSFIWGLALAGIMLQLGAFIVGQSEAYERVAYLFYLALGWIPVLWFNEGLFRALAPWGLALLVAGGIAYSMGIIFYLWKRLPYSHAVWHLFVVAGSAFHFFSILYYVVPI